MNTVIENEESGTVSPDLEIGTKRKKKFTGGNASKRHRDRVNVEFTNLAKLLPFPENVIAKLDKSSILRLAVSFIRAKSFFREIIGPIENGVVEETRDKLSVESFSEGTGTFSELFANALEGFLLVLTEDMKVLYVSESVRDYLGYCQAGIIHENFLQFVNPADHSVVKGNILYRKNEMESRTDTSHNVSDVKRYINGKTVHGTNTKRGCEPSGVVFRQFVCRMKCAFSCSSRFYTAYRTFQFSGHLKRSSIQVGREPKYLNTLVVYGAPLKGSKQTLDVLSESDEKSTSCMTSSPLTDQSDFTTYEQSYAQGFRIEPTLRPHIAPIPISNSEMGGGRFSPMQPKPRLVPELIPASEILKETYPPVLSYVPRLYCPSTTCDSRCSENSDDSKCSPATSPNLLWKRNLSTSQQHIPSYKTISEYYSSPCFNDYTTRDGERYGSQVKFGTEYRRNECASPGSLPVDVYRKRLPPTHADVFIGANMLMNLKQHRHAQRLDFPERHVIRKRSLDDGEFYLRSAKRLRSPAGNQGFHIKHLLGLDENIHNHERYLIAKELKSGEFKHSNSTDVSRSDRNLYGDFFYTVKKPLDYAYSRDISISAYTHSST